jgi:hypothetical protein
MNLNIINIISALTLFIFIQIGCKTDQNKLLAQKWKTVSLKNSTMEREIVEMKAYIDTLGANDPELRSAINIDSAKMILKAQLTQSLKEQKLAEENTLMEFKSNGVVYTTSIEGTDSAMYHIEDQFIKIDEAKLKGHGETMTFEIMKLDANQLQLRLIDYGDTSIVSMVPVK